MSSIQAFICDAVRTPIGRYGGALSSVRADDLGAIPIKALMERNAKVDWAAVERRPLRLRQPGRRGQPQRRPHGGAARRPAARACRARRSTACAARAWTRSARAARAIRAGEAELMIAGGVESMSRAPFVMPKAESAFARSQRRLRHDHRLALRQQAMKELYGVDSMPETAENVATDFKIEREAQDRMALRLAAEGRRGAEGRLLRRRDRAGDDRAEEGRPDRRRQGRASARHQPRGARQAEGRRPPRRHGHRRQRLGRQRRRLRAASLASERAAARHGLVAAGARRRHGDRRRRAAHHGHRPGAGDAEGARARRPGARRRST